MYSKEEIKKANKIAYGHIYSLMGLKFGNPLLVDKRTRIGKLAMSIYNENKNIDRKEAYEKRKSRKENKYKYTNIYDHRLVRDYNNNRKFLTGVYSDRLVFGSRNHWAKNDEDMVIIGIIRKHFLKRRKRKVKDLDRIRRYSDKFGWKVAIHEINKMFRVAYWKQGEGIEEYIEVADLCNRNDIKIEKTILHIGGEISLATDKGLLRFLNAKNTERFELGKKPLQNKYRDKWIKDYSC